MYSVLWSQEKVVAIVYDIKVHIYINIYIYIIRGGFSSYIIRNIFRYLYIAQYDHQLKINCFFFSGGGVEGGWVEGAANWTLFKTSKCVSQKKFFFLAARVGCVCVCGGGGVRKELITKMTWLTSPVIFPPSPLLKRVQQLSGGFGVLLLVITGRSKTVNQTILWGLITNHPPPSPPSQPMNQRVVWSWKLK